MRYGAVIYDGNDYRTVTIKRDSIAQASAYLKGAVDLGDEVIAVFPLPPEGSDNADVMELYDEYVNLDNPNYQVL